ncbi:MAG: hypothetical protein COC17_08320 [Hyphomicrobiales bacterium]|nr:MAG: hypothetical protein COC17_08320 [Hyphomicrobiales bacterium]
MVENKTYDLTIVSGRRPELLEATLESFFKKIINNIGFTNFYANVDPFCGTLEDGDKCCEIIKHYFPTCHIFRPEKASFGHAVKRLWQATTSDYVLHIEDDWLMLEDIHRSDVELLFNNETKTVSFMTKEKDWNGKNLHHQAYRKNKLLGLTYSRTRINVHTTSPCFLDGEFARMSGKLLDGDFDPEKQFRNGVNPDLESYALQYKNRFFIGTKQNIVCEDIGRDWRNSKNINKNIVDGKSIWNYE